MISGLIAQELDHLTVTKFNKLAVEEGLSQNSVKCILKDSYGFLWFGTRYGLNRYDSYEIEHIGASQDSGHELLQAEINDMLEDNNRKIWIAANLGLFYYDLEMDHIQKCNLNNNTITVTCLLPENDSMLWVGTGDGLLLYKKFSGILKEYKSNPYKKNSLSDSRIYSLCNESNHLWIGTEYGLNKLNKQNDSIVRFLHAEDPNSISGNYIRTLWRSKDSALWIGTEYNGLSKYNPETQAFTNYTVENSDLPHNFIRGISEAGNNSLWLATNGGGFALFDYEKEKFTKYQNNPDRPGSLSNNSTYSVLEDNTGMLWVGTYADGVNYTMIAPQSFQYISYEPNQPQSIVESKIRSLYLDSKNNLWVGTWGGFSRIDNKTGKVTSYASNPKNENTLSFNTVTCFYEDSKGRMWIGTYSGGLNLLKDDGIGFKHFMHKANDPYSLSSNQIYCIVEDHHQNLWIATNSGLNRYDEKNNLFEVYNDYDIRDIEVDENGDLLLALKGGIGKFSIYSKSFDFFESETLTGYFLNFVNQSSDGKIWFGTQAKGMGYLILESSKYIIYTIDDGLPSNYVSEMIHTSDSIIWMSTYRGLSKFNSNQNKLENYGLTDGLPAYEFFPRSATRLTGNRLAFGSSKGMVYFDPQKVDATTDYSPIIINNLKIKNNTVAIGPKSILKKAIYETEQITLNHDEKYFTIEYAALDYNSFGNTRYEYILEDYLEEWVSTGTTRSISFTNLDPGEYVFRVRVLNERKNALNVTSIPEANLTIHIKPSFWQTWYFKAVLILLLMLLLYLYNLLSLIPTKQKKMLLLKKMEFEKQEKFVHMKLRFFSNITHEFKTPLTLIIDPIQTLKKRKPDRESLNLVLLVEKSVLRLQKLVNQILDFGKMEEGETLELKVEKKDIISAVYRIFNSFTETAKNQQIHYTINLPADEHFGWFDEDKLEKILYNILSNAFKFTPANGKISLTADIPNPDGNKIEICIKDSGKGIRDEELPKIFERFYTDQSSSVVSRGGIGIGLAMVKKLCDLHHGTIEVESERGVGTAFRLYLPLDYQAYSDYERMKPESILEDMAEETIQSEVESLTANQENSDNKQQILVVEDDFDILQYLNYILSPHFEVLTANNGKEGIEILKEHRPDLILSDTAMPEMNGIEFCKHVRSNSETSGIPFIFLSVWSSDDFKLKGLHTGATDYITKPFNSDVLIAKIKNTLALGKISYLKSGDTIKITPNEEMLENLDHKFIVEIQKILEENISDPEFNSTILRDKLNMSHSFLYRRLKKLTGLSSNELIREYRLQKAAQILKMNTGLNINEIGLKVGFIDPKYFSYCFKKKYDLTPSEFIIQHAAGEKDLPEQFPE
jgi:ligand-binding sensor domain-containing protein/signal transduction histidine kinase/CheY-like chemotaxis protein